MVRQRSCKPPIAGSIPVLGSMTNIINMTDDERFNLRNKLNAKRASREELEKRHKLVLSSEELDKYFTVTNFYAPFVFVTSKTDGQFGAFLFQHQPRYYFGWVPCTELKKFAEEVMKIVVVEHDTVD